VSKKSNGAIAAAVIAAVGGIIAAVISSHHSDPTPAPGPTYASGTIQTTSGTGYAYVYSVPTGNLYIDREGEESNGTNVQIICTQQGPAVDNDTLWDEIVYNDGSAYISDFYVYTGTNQPTMPSCS
jgi:hypothetical protein